MRSWKSLQNYLFWLELLSLSGEIGVAIKGAIVKNIQKSAKEVLEHSDDLYKYAKNVDEIKEVDDLIKHLDDISEIDYLAKWDELPISGKGYLRGKTLRRKEIKFWIDEIKKISKGESKLIILPKGHPSLNGKQAGFNPFNGNIYVQKGLTEYEVFHEYKHLEEYVKLGKEEYLNGMMRISGDIELDLIRTYKREMYVYNQVLNQSNKFNKEQLKHAFEKNIQPLLEKLENSGIDITKIKITK